MLDSAAIGAIIGFLGRAGPEILKFADRHFDRRHELAMQDKALEFERIPGRAGKISEKAMIDAGQLQDVLALTREAYAQQFNTQDLLWEPPAMSDLSSDENENRIASDANFASLALRVDSLERRVEVVELEVRNNSRELAANTQITKQVHEVLFGREEDEGIRDRVKEMHEVFSNAKRGLAMLNGLADAGARYGKPVLYLVLIVGAIGAWFKTGDFKWPSWPA